MTGPSTRHLVLGGAAVVGAATAATSAVSLYSLAIICGIPPYLAAALPIALDAGAAVAALVWVTEEGALRNWGRGIALAALAGTLGGNALSHVFVDERPPLLVILAVGACIPAMLFAVVHLAAMLVRPTPTKEPEKTGKTPKRATKATTAPPPVVAQPPPEERTDGVKLTAFDYARLKWPLTAQAIREQTGCSKSHSHRVFDTIDAERKALELVP